MSWQERRLSPDSILTEPRLRCGFEPTWSEMMLLVFIFIFNGARSWGLVGVGGEETSSR